MIPQLSKRLSLENELVKKLKERAYDQTEPSKRISFKPVEKQSVESLREQ